MEQIYAFNEEQEQSIGTDMRETRSADMEKKFINSVCDMVIEALSVGWNDRRIVKALLEKIFYDKINNRGRNNPGLLQQYEAYAFNLASERIITELELPEGVKVNHGFATHAKFADIVDAIKKKLETSDKK